MVSATGIIIKSKRAPVEQPNIGDKMERKGEKPFAGKDLKTGSSQVMTGLKSLCQHTESNSKLTDSQ